MANKKIMVIDGNSLINRAFYGIKLLTAPDGTYTNAVYGFLSILSKLLDDEKPDCLCVCFDVHSPTFRHKKYTAYKAQRRPMPEELRPQLPLLKEVLSAMNILYLEKAGWEADDLIGTLSLISDKNNYECVIVTGDRDSLQLVSNTTRVKLVVTKSGKSSTIDYTPEQFYEDYQFPPQKIVDLKALWGDSSDNIPGVPGIGEKTAFSLIQQFGSLENVYNHLDDAGVSKTQREKLINGKDSAEISYELATICREVPIEFKLEDATLKDANNDDLYKLFIRLNFKKFIERWHLVAPIENKKAIEDSNAFSDLPLFGNYSENTDKKTILQNDLTKDELLKLLENLDEIFFYIEEDASEIYFLDDVKKIISRQKCDGGEDDDAFLKTFFQSKIKKITHDAKRIYRIALKKHFNVENLVFDTMIAAYLINPTTGHYTIDVLSAQENHSFFLETIRDLYEIQKENLKTLELEKIFYELEMPLIPILAEMENEGIFIDKKKIEDYSIEMQKGADIAQKEIYTLAEEEFNLNSPKQMGEILFEKLKLPFGKKTKNGYSTNADILKKLKNEHPIISKIEDFRFFSKMKTISDGLISAIQNDGRIHTTFNMTTTATGRLSSSEPNLQNIPTRNKYGDEIRKMFIAKKGNVLVDADYSQIELRILAHISDDPIMKKAFEENEDIHSATACQVFNIEKEQLTPTMRRHAKAINFGIIYGISAFSLSEDLNISRKDAKVYMDNYLEKYSKVKKYMEDVVAEAKEKGFVKTLLGRRRNLPELKSVNHNLRAFGERVALNAPIQGTAADIMKIAMIRVYKRLKTEKINAKLILQIHDELIVESSIEDVDAVRKLLSEEMQNAYSLNVPLVADSKIGNSWFDAK